MPTSDYLHLFLGAGVSAQSDQESYGRRLDAVVAHEQISVRDIIGIGERGTAGTLDLYVIHGQAVVLVTEHGMFKNRIEVQRLASIANLAEMRKTVEGLRGDLTITATDATGLELFKIVWSLGGPDWVGRLGERQHERLLSVIGEAMDAASD
jgi:hypothetical protein